MIRTAETHPLTWRLRVISSRSGLMNIAPNKVMSVRKKRSHGAYPVTDQVKAAGLRGRGGAGFPTGVKWSLVPMDPQFDKNTFFVMPTKWNPVLTKIVCWWNNCRINWSKACWLVLMRWKPIVVTSSCAAVYRSRTTSASGHWGNPQSGFLGKTFWAQALILSCLCTPVPVVISAVKKQHLINSLEGRRANPRAKPPFPALAGAWGKPTCVNNVETLNNIPSIMQTGWIGIKAFLPVK